MRLKTILVTVVLLAIVSAVVFIAQRPGPPASKDPRVGQPIIDRSVVEKAGKLQISDQGKTVSLARQPDGSWRDESYYDLPADFSKLSSFVGNLTDAKVDRFVTANPDRLSRLEFKDTKIALLDAAGKPIWSLTLGKNAETGGGRFIQFDDEKKAYLASLNAWLDTDAKSWANAELLNLKPDDVAKIEVEFPATEASSTEPKSTATPASTVMLSRAKKDAPWTADKTPVGQKVSAEKVSSLLNTAGNIRFSETTAPSDPAIAEAKAHQRVVKLTTFDGKTYTVTMGRKPEEKKLKPAAAKPAAAAKVDEKSPASPKKTEPEKPAAPEYETIPAGPVFVSITSSDASAPINALMQKRAFQVADYTFTSLSQKPADLFEAAPPPSVPVKPEPAKPAPAVPAKK